jgi:hypothetical protein
VNCWVKPVAARVPIINRAKSIVKRSTLEI